MFASDLWGQIKRDNIHTWICGHSHETRDLIGDGERGKIRFAMNQRGYPGEETEFDAAFLSQVSRSQRRLGLAGRTAAMTTITQRQVP